MTISGIIAAILAAGGGGALVAFLVMKMFGEKWLDSRFAGRLQELAHQHERRMEDQRLEASRALDRSVRLTEREFETTAQAWAMVHETYQGALGALPGFRTHDDFSRLSDELARIVLEKNDFEEWEIAELLDKPVRSRNQYFNDRTRFHERQRAREIVRRTSEYLQQKSMFMHADIYRSLSEFVEWAWQAIVAHEIVQEAGARNLAGIERHDEAFRKDAPDRFKQLEQLVRSRFWGNDTAVKDLDPEVMTGPAPD